MQHSGPSKVLAVFGWTLFGINLKPNEKFTDLMELIKMNGSCNFRTNLLYQNRDKKTQKTEKITAVQQNSNRTSSFAF
ncbi:hypothetical protein ACJX0J_006148, partial [Zea mays]